MWHLLLAPSFPFSKGDIRFLFSNHSKHKFSFLQSRPDHSTNIYNVNNKLFLMGASKQKWNLKTFEKAWSSQKVNGLRLFRQRIRDSRSVHCSFQTTKEIKKYATVSFSLRKGIKRKRFILSGKNSNYMSISKNSLPTERHSKWDYFSGGFWGKANKLTSWIA